MHASQRSSPLTKPLLVGTCSEQARKFFFSCFMFLEVETLFFLCRFAGKMGRFSSTMEHLEKELRKSGSVQDESLFETMRQKLFLPTLETLVQEGITVPTVSGSPKKENI